MEGAMVDEVNEVKCDQIFHNMCSFFPCGFRRLLFAKFVFISVGYLLYFYGVLI